MAPLVPIFPASALPERVNVVTKNFKEKHRKGPPIELEKCQLLEMLQYSCQPPQMGSAPVCTPIVRWFRRCAGGLTVETTAWEHIKKVETETDLKPSS